MNKETESHIPLVRFLHPVGQSTLKQGLTVPIGAQVSWLVQIRKGEKVAVQIKFGEGQSVQADLRRINNAVGHLQFRYETQRQSELRDYLVETFGERPESAVLEIIETEPRIFVFKPVSTPHASPKLSLYKPHFHNLDEYNIRAVNEFQELQRCLASISYDAKYSQSDYNKLITDFLIATDWEKEVQVLKEIGLRCDFEKNGVWLEVEFGNARAYYQDYIKVLLASHYRNAHFGVMLCPTRAFAQLLCELGQKRAQSKHTNKDKAPTYSGMMSYEKAIRELPFLRFMLNGGIVVAGIDIGGIP